MTLQDWNPLKFFRELGLITRTVFLLAFIFLGVGIATDGLKLHNRTVILSSCDGCLQPSDALFFSLGVPHADKFPYFDQMGKFTSGCRDVGCDSRVWMVALGYLW